MTENTNLTLWNSVEKTDPNFTKQFNRGGGFKGTATSAVYLIKKATKMFGPIGIGWGYDIVNEEVLQGFDQHRVHKIQLKLWYMWDGKRGEVTQFGQTDFVGKNKNGWFTDEEAPKKSLTDALSKCLSYIGFAADIHLGLYDDNKYFNELRREFRDADEFGEQKSPANDRDGRASPPDRKPKDAGKDADKGAGQDDGDQSAEDVIKRLKAAIDDKETFDDVIALMTHKATQSALKNMPKVDADDIRAYGQARMKALGWMSSADTKKAESEKAESADAAA